MLSKLLLRVALPLRRPLKGVSWVSAGVPLVGGQDNSEKGVTSPLPELLGCLDKEIPW